MTSRLGLGSSLPTLIKGGAVVALMAILTLNRLGAADVCGGSEAAMAVYVQQMVERHELLFPLDNCAIPMYKPPLYHWTATALAASMREKTATAFNLRLPSALYAIAGTIVVMLFAGSLLGPSAAVLAGLILCGSYQYVSQGRIGLVDMTLAFFETLALYAFFRWFVLRGEDGGACESRSTTVMHYVFAVATGLAVLAKGPVGMLMPGGAAIIFLLVHREWAALRDLIKVGPLIVGAVCASSWYLACLATGHLDFLKLQMGSENFGRFFGSLGSMPPWYYVQPILLNSLPLSLFVPMAVVCALWPQRRQGPDSGATGTGAPATLEPRGPAAWGINLLALFWIVSVAFFAIASYKRRNYLLPVWPAAAVLLAWWVIDYLPRGLRTGRAGNIYRVTVGVCLASAIANFVFIPPYELHNCGVPFNLRSLSRWPSAVFAGKSPSDAKQVRSYRAAAAAIDHLTDPHEPVYVIGIDDALEPLVFYLGRCARPLHSWRDLPAEGFIITTVSAWSRTTAPHSGWSPVAKISYGSSDLILLKIRRNETATTLNPAVLP